MNLNKIAITVYLILIIILLVIAFGTYLMIISTNMNKTDEDKK